MGSTTGAVSRIEDMDMHSVEGEKNARCGRCAAGVACLAFRRHQRRSTIDRRSRTSLIKAMLRALVALALVMTAALSATAMVGGAAPASGSVGQAAVIVLDSRGGSC